MARPRWPCAAVRCRVRGCPPAWMAARSWSKVATPSTRPSPSTPTAWPAGDSTAASSAARSESVPTVKAWPSGSARSLAERGAARQRGQRRRVRPSPAARRPPASVTQIHGCAGRPGPCATVASAGSTGPVASGQPGGRDERQPPDARGRSRRSRPRSRRRARPAAPPAVRAGPACRAGRNSATRSPTLMASSMSWVTSTIVLRSSACRRQQLVLQRGADHRVDGAERLVHQQHRRVGGQRPGHADALLLAAGQLVRVAPGQLRVEADQGEQFPRAVAGLLARPAVEHRDRGDVVLDGAVREQAGLLDHVADAAAQLGRVARPDVGAVEQDPCPPSARPAG